MNTSLSGQVAEAYKLGFASYNNLQAWFRQLQQLTEIHIKAAESFSNEVKWDYIYVLWAELEQTVRVSSPQLKYNML